jgi:polyisoprenyl-teichoic acid--peptidoglycan teichoic acid transferase
MAGGRSSGSRGGGAGNDPLRGLAQLGQGDASSGSAKPANEDGLKSLGERIHGGPRRGGGPAHRRNRRRWSTKRRVLTTLGIVVVLMVAVVGSGYAYLRYEWGKVQKVACTSCAVVTSSIAPFNVLIVGSDSRAGNTGQAAQSFGTASEVAGQRSDTIKILHVDPQSGTAQLLSIPRDTWVEMSGLPANSGLTGPQKINTAFDDGPVPLVDTIQNTFGIPINHFVVINFTGLINAVQSVGGINMNVPFPVRDDDDGNNNSGLDIATTGCQTLNGNEVLALARSRYFQYYDPAEGGWNGDPTSDLGRIQRQNEIIEALMAKVEATYNPLTLKSFLDSVVHDITVDQGLGLTEIYDLADRYHAFSPSSLQVLTLPTVAEQNYGGDIQVVEQPQAQQMLTQFLGVAPNTPSTPPLDENDDPVTYTPGTGTGTGTGTSTSSVGGTAASLPGTTTTTTTIPPFDPTPC